MLLTPLRRHLRSWWPWLGGLIALLIFLPNLIWQIQHDWPTLEFLLHKHYAASPLVFLVEQAFYTHPAGFLLAWTGLTFFFSAAGRPYHVLGWAFLVVFATMMVLRGNPYYVTPVYPMLIATGALRIEQWSTGRQRLAWLRPAAVILVVTTGLLLAPLALPVLPVEAVTTYMYRLQFDEVFSLQGDYAGQLPPHFSNMFGWEAIVAGVDQAYRSLSPEEQAEAIVLTRDYALASAVNYLGADDLPPAISGHNNYFLWGTGDASGEVVIAVGYRSGELLWAFEGMQAVTRVTIEERGWSLTIYVCRRPRILLDRMWPQLRYYG